MFRSVKALARLRLCAGLPEPLLVAYVISILFSCAGTNIYRLFSSEANKQKKKRKTHTDRLDSKPSKSDTGLCCEPIHSAVSCDSVSAL